MERELARDAVKMKMSSKWESPLISIYEFAYASGLALSFLKIPKETQQELRKLEHFEEFHDRIMTLLSDADQPQLPEEVKLLHMIRSYRIHEELNEDAGSLFDEGYQG